MPGIKIPNGRGGVTGDIFWTLFSQNHRPCFVPTVLPRIRFGPSPFCKSHLAPRQRQTSSIDLSWPHCLRWKEVRFNQSGVGTQFTGPHVVAHSKSKPPKSDRRKVSPLLRLPHSTPIPPHALQSSSCQHSYAPRSLGGQSAKTNLVRSNYSVANPRTNEGRPILEKESNFFISVTHLARQWHSPDIPGIWRKWESQPLRPNITVIPAQIESTTRWNEMK